MVACLVDPSCRPGLPAQGQPGVRQRLLIARGEADAAQDPELGHLVVDLGRRTAERGALRAVGGDALADLLGRLEPEHQRDPFERRLAQRLQARAGAQKKGRAAAERTRPEGHRRDAPKPARVAEGFLRERAAHDRGSLFQPCVPLREWHAEGPELVGTETGAETHQEPPVTEVVDPGDLLGEPQGVMQRQYRHRVADLDPPRALGHGRGVDRWRADEPERREMVLGDPDASEAAALGAIDFPERLLDHLAVGVGLRRGQKLKDSQFHGGGRFDVPRYQDKKLLSSLPAGASWPRSACWRRVIAYNPGSRGGGKPVALLVARARPSVAWTPPAAALERR
jgi:hypothetical protein